MKKKVVALAAVVCCGIIAGCVIGSYNSKQKAAYREMQTLAESYAIYNGAPPEGEPNIRFQYVELPSNGWVKHISASEAAQLDSGIVCSCTVRKQATENKR